MGEVDGILDFLSAFSNSVRDSDILIEDNNAIDDWFEALLNQREPSSPDIDQTIPPIKQNTTPSTLTFASFRSPHKRSADQSSDVANKPLRICSPQPDEILQGWRARMWDLNCNLDPKDVDKLIIEIARQRNESISVESGYVECAATILGISPQLFLQKYTLTPFFNALKGLKTYKPGTKSSRHRAAYERTIPFKLGTKSPRFCPHCVKEEVKGLGFAYWHRSHQLLGVVLCLKHESYLLRANSQNAFNKSPHLITDALFDDRLHDLTETQTEILKRYAVIASAILNNSSGIDSRIGSAALGRQAKTTGLRISKLGKRTTVSTYLMQTLPIWWLLETVPRTTWKMGHYICTIDGACVPGETRYIATTLSLIAAALFESPTIALSELYNANDPENSRQRGFDYWAKKEILDEYIAQQGVVSRVAERLSLPHSTVGVGLLNQGLPGLGRGSPSTTAFHTFLNGQDLRECLSMDGVSVKEFESLLRVGCSRLKTALNSMRPTDPSPTEQVA